MRQDRKAGSLKKKTLCQYDGTHLTFGQRQNA